MNVKVLILGVIMVSGVNVLGDLIAYWPLYEGSGQVAGDASGNSNNGILGDTMEPEPADPAWVSDLYRGTVLEWTGDGGPRQWVNLTSHVDSFDELNQGTIMAWIKIPGDDGVDVIMAASDSGDGSSELRFYYELSYGGLILDVREDSSSPTGESGNVSWGGTAVADNNWHHVAVTVDSSANATLYVDGAVVTSDVEPFFSGVKDLDHMSLGRNVDAGGAQWVFKGRMSDVAVFDTPLSPDIINAVYNGRSVLDVDKIASNPSPANDAEHVSTSVTLTWQSGVVNPEYTVYFGTDPAFPFGAAAAGLTDASYTPESLNLAETYYWRIDVNDNGENYPGSVWSFSTVGKATSPSPANNETGVYTGSLLSWTGDGTIGSYDVYLGETGQPLSFKENTTQTQFMPGQLQEYTTYKWRIDTRDADSALIAAGDVWHFTTQAAGVFYEEVDIFVRGTEGYACYRIPSIIVAPNGDVLAFCEGRKNNCGDHGDVDIVMKRSTDNGRTWGPLELIYEEGDTAHITIGNPCPVVDESNGRLWMPFCRNNDRVFVGYSDDSGYTWSPRREVTSEVKPPEWGWYATGPGVGIQLKNEPYQGRLIIPSDHGYDQNGSHMMYSDDHGITWTYSERILPGCNECQAVELIDGTVMNNARTYSIDPDHRGIATSADGGQTWSEIWFDQALPEPTCQASFLRLTRSDFQDINRVLFSNPASTSSRINMTVKLSYDEGATWPVARQIYAGSSAYSCLVVMPDWTIGCLYEKDSYSKITLARFSLEWLTEGADKFAFCSSSITGDVNEDCIVNVFDFALMTANWLECNLMPQKACP